MRSSRQRPRSLLHSDGKTELGSFAIQNRQPITLKQMPDNIKQAVVAAENRSFWTDKGVSITRHGAPTG